MCANQLKITFQLSFLRLNLGIETVSCRQLQQIVTMDMHVHRYHFFQTSSIWMTSEKQAQKLHNDDVSLPQIWVVILIG